MMRCPATRSPVTGVATIGYKSRVGPGGSLTYRRAGSGRQHIMGSPIVHFELIGKDAAGLKAFYSQLFGWEIGDLMPDMGNYGLIDGGSSGLPGGVGQSDDGKPRVTVYAQVDDLQATLDRAVALGGAVVMPPTEIPGVTWLALFTDPDGNVFGLTKGS